MTRRLLLMRHAKSDWSGPETSDHARRLNPRGQASAKAIGDWLRQFGYLPDLVLSSDSQRTRDTLEGLQLDATARFHRTLYLAPPEIMLNALQQAGDAPCVLMLGHNPGIAAFAWDLLEHQPDDPDFERYPTCATAVIDFPITDWKELVLGQGALLDFTVPRRLT